VPTDCIVTDLVTLERFDDALAVVASPRSIKAAVTPRTVSRVGRSSRKTTCLTNPQPLAQTLADQN
jgi:hypothetical protein